MRIVGKKFEKIQLYKVMSKELGYLHLTLKPEGWAVASVASAILIVPDQTEMVHMLILKHTKDIFTLPPKEGEVYRVPFDGEIEPIEACGSDVCSDEEECEHCREPKKLVRLLPKKSVFKLTSKTLKKFIESETVGEGEKEWWVKATKRLPQHRVMCHIKNAGRPYIGYYDYSRKVFMCPNLGPQGVKVENVEWLDETIIEEYVQSVKHPGEGEKEAIAFGEWLNRKKVTSQSRALTDGYWLDRERVVSTKKLYEEYKNKAK